MKSSEKKDRPAFQPLSKGSRIAVAGLVAGAWVFASVASLSGASLPWKRPTTYVTLPPVTIVGHRDLTDEDAAQIAQSASRNAIHPISTRQLPR